MPVNKGTHRVRDWSEGEVRPQRSRLLVRRDGKVDAVVTNTTERFKAGSQLGPRDEGMSREICSCYLGLDNQVIVGGVPILERDVPVCELRGGRKIVLE